MPNIDQRIDEEFPCLAGQFLIAMPGKRDPCFAKALIYICAHSADGAMGLIVNRAIDTITFSDMLQQLEIDVLSAHHSINVLSGGPVESSRGFVLHTNDYSQDASLAIDNDLTLTATLDIIKAIAIGAGPLQCLLALGYAFEQLKQWRMPPSLH